MSVPWRNCGMGQGAFGFWGPRSQPARLVLSLPKERGLGAKPKLAKALLGRRLASAVSRSQGADLSDP